MSKQLILVCDRHKEAIPAIGSYELRNGQGLLPTIKLDLCSVCVTEVTAFFTPVKNKVREPSSYELDSAERKRARDRDRYHEHKGHKPKSVVSPYWEPKEKAALAVLTQAAKSMNIHDVVHATGLGRATAGNTLRRLVRKGLVGTTGGVGRYRRYHIPV